MLSAKRVGDMWKKDKGKHNGSETLDCKWLLAEMENLDECWIFDDMWLGK